MRFVLKAYCNYDWVSLPGETFGDYRAACVRAAALLRDGLAGADMVAVCARGEGDSKGRVVACLTASESRGARGTEWPGVWQWGPSADAAEEPARAAVK